MQNINLIRKLAWSFHRSTGLDLDDLMQEAAYAYCLAMKSYDQTRGKFSTHCWWVITSHLKNYLKQERKYTDPLLPIEEIKGKPAYGTNFFECLTKEAQEVARIVLSSPRSFICLPPEDVERRVRQILSREGWTEGRIQIGINDIRLACK